MRKYKDVGKRILTLILTICIFSTLFAEVPVYAAEGDIPEGVVITLGTDPNGAVFKGNDTYVYSRKEVRPSVQIQADSVTLEEGTDYKLLYSNNINAGTANIQVIGLKEQYEWTFNKTFTIEKQKLDYVGVDYAGVEGSGTTGDSSYVYYTGKDELPVIKEVYGILAGTQQSVTLAESDYKVTYVAGQNKSVGLHNFKVELSDTSNYSFTKTIEERPYYIYYNLGSDTVSVTGLTSVVYNGKAQTPSFTITDSYNASGITQSDYIASWSNNTNVGTATLTITADTRFNYRGSKSFTFDITKADMSDSKVSVELAAADGKYYYVKNGQPDMSNEVIVKINGTIIPSSNYNVSYINENPGAIGRNVLQIDGKDNMMGTITYPFYIYDRLGTAVLSSTELEYTGKKNVPTITVKNTAGDIVDSANYTVKYYTDESYAPEYEIEEPTKLGEYFIQIKGTESSNGKVYYEDTIGTAANPLSYRITAKSLDKCRFSLLINGANAQPINANSNIFGYYDGSSRVLSLTAVDDEGNKLNQGSNQDFTYAVYRDPECTVLADDDENTPAQDLIETGTYYIKVSGVADGNYAGSEKIFTYTINPKAISPTNIVVKNQTYTGSAVVPDPANITVVYKNDLGQVVELSGADNIEVVSCGNNVAIGDKTATVFIRLKGNYTLAASALNYGMFSIVERKISECTINFENSFVYNGSKQVPLVRITDNGGTKGLVEGKDFTVTFFTDSTYKTVIEEPVNAGTYYMLIGGLGVYANKEADANVKTSFEITQKDISGLLVTASNMPYADGGVVIPTIHVTDGNTELIADTDYEVEGYYSDEACTIASTNTEAGKVYVKIKAKADSNYIGTATTSFYIGSNLSALVPAFNVSGGVYNCDSHYDEILSAIQIQMGKTITDTDAYSITFYADDKYQIPVSDPMDELFKNAGNVYFKVSGKKGYYGDVSGIAVIAKKDISELDARVVGTYVYNGLEQKIEISTDSAVDGLILQYPDTNGYILTKDEYSIASSTNAINAGTATLTLRAATNSNFTGTKVVTYTIAPKNLNDLDKLKITVDKVTFSNDVQTPSVTVTYGDTSKTLKLGTEFQYTIYSDKNYTNPASNEELTNAGTTYIKIQGTGNYTGVLASVDCVAEKFGSNEFIIEPLDIARVGVDIEGKHYFFSTNIPEFTVTQEFAHGTEVYTYSLQPGIDFSYTPTSISGFKVGRQNLTITGQGNFKGTRNTFFYYDGNLNNSANQVEVTLGHEEVAYNASDAAGEGMKPGTIAVYATGTDPKQKLEEGVDYTISYRNNKVPGQASAVITGKEGSYWVGSYIANYKITGNIADAEISVPAQAYTGSEYNATTQPIQNMQVVCDGKTLVLGTDYRIKTISNAKDVTTGGASVTIEGIGEYFSGEKSASFDIKYDLGDSKLVIDIGGDTFSYTGSPITPVPTVKYYTSDTTFDQLLEGVDYTVTYRNNTEVAPANGQSGPCVIIQATTNGKLLGGTKAQPFTIDSIHLEDYEITGVADSYMYTGKMIMPSFTVKKKSGSQVIDAANYDVYYETDAANPATAPAGATETITVIGKGNYDGVITKTFTITPRDLTRNVTATIENQTYCGEEIKPEVTFTFDDENGQEQTLTYGTDYSVVEYKNNINAAVSSGPNAPYATVIGLNSCSGTLKIPFTIEKKSMEDLVYSSVEDPEYEPLKAKYEPPIEVYMSTTSDVPLEKDVVYTATYLNNSKVASANGTTGPYIRITPKDTTNYTGVKTIPFSILAKDISGEDIIGTLSDSLDTGFDPVTRNYPYTAGVEYKPNIRLTDHSGETVVALQNGVDYMFSYSSNNNQVGTAYISITGQGNYTGTRMEKFTIGTLLSESTITVTGISDKEYNGLDTTPANIQVKFNQTGEMLAENSDYVVKYYVDEDCLTEASAIDLIHAGTIYVAIIGTENQETGYVGMVVIPYEISRKSLTSADIEITGNDSMDYTGSELKPVLTLKDTSTGLIIDPSQYEVLYENNVEIGTASATITATDTGNYKDSITVYYKITKHNIDRVTAEAIPDQMYTGDYIIPEMTLYDNGKLLVEGVDYEVTNGNNLRAGESWVIIKGLGNYDQTKRVYFNIVASMEQAIVEDIPDQLYTGNPIKPSVSVVCGGNTLVEGEDYTVTYANNIVRGDASVTIRPLTQYYTGTIVKKFKITNSIESATVSGIPASVLYNGSAYQPIPAVTLGGKTLTQGLDYTVSYKNNVNVGTASVIVTGTGLYSGSKTVTFKITEKSINNCTIYTVSSQTYNGKLLTPPVVVKDGRNVLVQNKDYVLSYANNLNVGTGSITITGRGDYKGAVTKNFEIIEQVPVQNVLIQNKNATAGTFDIVIDGVAESVTTVRVPVWTKSNQSDIYWYTASRVDTDTFIVHANQKNHKNNVGIYNIHVYTSGINNSSKLSFATTTVFGSGYENVFDYKYYIEHNPDVARAFGGNTEQIFNHFVNNGMKEGRQAIENFNVQSYRARYADLRAAFRNNLPAYYRHYISCGKKEGRIATGSTVYQNAVTVYNGVDYRLVYDYNYYIAHNADVARVFNGDEYATLRHFVEYGMKEGRQAIANFNVQSYRARYADLRAAFRNDLPAYYRHYINCGKREGRIATGSTVYQNAVTVYNGIDYKLVYDYNYYIAHNADVARAFNGDEYATLRHFVDYGMKEGRQAINTFNVNTYKRNYADLRSAFGNDLKSYYIHYINYGYREGRKAN